MLIFSGIVEELIKSGNVIEAIFVAHEADLLERFPPVPLLKSYLRNSTDKAQAGVEKWKTFQFCTCKYFSSALVPITLLLIA